MQKIKAIRHPLLFLSAMFFVFIALFSVFRFLFYKTYVTNAGDFSPSQLHFSLVTGFEFDSMIAAYIMMLPALLLLINSFLKKPSILLINATMYILYVLIIVVVLILCADIPYYKFFKSRLTTSALMWLTDFKQSIEYVFSETQFYFFMLLFLVAVSILFWFINFLKKKMLVRTSSNELSSGIKFLLLFLTIGLAIHAARGFNKKHPPQIKEAFFSKNVFINQLSINPVLSFFESISIFKIDYMPDEKALALAQKSLNCNQPVSNSPIARIEQNDSRVGKKNVVLVLMEGMSAYKTGRFEPQKKLTPFLDSLSNVGLFFPNFFSCGIHTCNGVYGTLFGFPSLMAIHPLSNVASSNLYFDGMPSTLKKNGYTNLFFCTHDDQFDNMNYFLMRNGIDKMFGAKDYPASMRENVWGINDEYLFDFALRKTDSLAETGNPFFSTILTISTHPPHQTPKLTKFKPKSLQVIDQVYEYADFALQKFLKSCAEKKWFDNTVFIFVADHGINLPSNLEAPLSFNHVPLIIYCSDTSFKPAEVESFGMQTDIYPTVMSLLGISFLNNTMGVNLLKHQRPFAYFSQDNRLCVINNNRLLIINKYGSRYFYDYKRGISINAEGSNTSTIDSMANYAYSMLQTTQWMIEKKLVGMNK